MDTSNLNEADQLVRYSRRGLWTMLFLFLVIGLPAAAALGFPDSDWATYLRRLWVPLPLIIVIALVALKSSARGIRTDASSPAMKAMLNDELRQDSLKRAYRNAFFGMMMVQPLLAVAPAWIAVAHPAPLMACLTVLVGALVMTASLLYYDR
jgi:hypothetical protein